MIAWSAAWGLAVWRMHAFVHCGIPIKNEFGCFCSTRKVQTTFILWRTRDITTTRYCLSGPICTHTSGVISRRKIRGRGHVLMRHNQLRRYRIPNNSRVDDGQLLLHSRRSSLFHRTLSTYIDIRVSVERHHPHTLCSLRQQTKYTASKACRRRF